MNQVRILPEILANKIAAGEVVERPASVVKELVENALDAGSTRITIDIEKGGRSLIQVADNGMGMNHDDALLALERFATSKIHTDNDLFSIQTLGFRGEALPSIAAVSKMTLVTRTGDSDSGVQINIHGGKIMDVNEAGAPPGTMISVARLFYNTPARRKFLKTVNTEMGHIADVVSGMALSRPQVHFKLTHNGKIVKQWTKTKDSAQRAAAVLGKFNGQDLIPLSVECGNLKISGHIGPSRLARSTSRGIYLYVNGRRVRDRVVQHALFEGFHGRLMKGQYPLAVLFLELPFDQVDVNVHPTKHEIRFADQRHVHNSVRDQVSLALSRAERRLWTPTDRSDPAEDPLVYEKTEPYRIPQKKQTGQRSATTEPFTYQNHEESIQTTSDISRPFVNFDQPSRQPTPRILKQQPSKPLTEQKKLWKTEGFADLEVIGQIHDTYIICQSSQGLILIDQHAAHERIVYEQLNTKSGHIESQRLLMPETLELGFAETEALKTLIPHLDPLGLEIEPFGGNTFIVKSFPVLLDDRNITRIIIELVDKTTEIGLEANLDRVLDECRMVMACHNAIRASQRLTDTQIDHMLKQLDQCSDPSHCPHGRPTWIQWTLRDLEKLFKRVGG